MRKRSANQFLVAFVVGDVFTYCPNRKRFELLGWFDFKWQVEELCEVLTQVRNKSLISTSGLHLK